MKITLNGSVVETDGTDLSALVRERGLDASSLVIEHNFEVVQQARWAETPVREGDTVELLAFVGGG